MGDRLGPARVQAVNSVKLGAPVSGWAMPLDQVDDPVFAERMMGDGLAIDPLEGLIVAPAAASVAAIAPTGHSVTLALENGAHLLIHVGLETVALGGQGFEPLITQGERVAAGVPLIRFDMDLVARRAKSLVTPIVLIDPGYRLAVEAVGRRVLAGDLLLTVAGETQSAEVIAGSGGNSIERLVSVRLANGLHARPAARIVHLLKSHSAGLTLSMGGRSADARSMVALLALGVKGGSEVLLSATGAEAELAVAGVAALLQETEAETSPASSPPPRPSNIGTAIAGVVAAPGLAIGPIAHFRHAVIEAPADGAGAEVEERALEAAILAVGQELKAASGAGEGVAEAHLAIVEDPELIAHARLQIAAGRSAGFAWRSATAAAAGSIRATGNPLLIERIADLEDVERRLLSWLAGVDSTPSPDFPGGAILIAEDLLPSQFMALGSALAGIVTARGGPTSHVAVLAGSAGIPMLVAAGARVLDLPQGGTAILDGDAGTLDPTPDPTFLAQARGRLTALSAQRAAEAAAALEECRMLDGTRIEIFANLASQAEALRAVDAGAEGCGLLRTEILFQDRAEAPSEEEQARVYSAIATALDGRPLIVRTLDIGGDKPVAYLPTAREDNPALGLRGIRLSLAYPALLESQIRAILRAVPASQCRIMVPMVVERDELRAVRAMVESAKAATGRSDPVALGVMIETPAAALLASSLAEEADFLSIGTNDLTQYALACDRGNPATAARVDALHPAVLQLIRAAAEGARKHGRWLGICGGIASDPIAAALLIGLGATELSAAPAMIPAVKAAVRNLRLEECRKLAERALLCASATEVRNLLAPDGDALRGAA